MLTKKEFIVEKANFLLVGVGGQGILTASDILADVGLRAGYDAKKSEVHGMAQRGGAVISHVRFAETVYAPLIARGEVDYLLAFELVESLRWAHFLRPEGCALVNRQQLPPVSVTSGSAKYPETDDILEELQKRSQRAFLIEGLKTAQDLGNIRVTNTVLLGALSALLPIDGSIWEHVIVERVPSRYADLNRQAFHLGRKQVESA
jgi:indolepyruvate ferredoxin oxidoreductase beta subunit